MYKESPVYYTIEIYQDVGKAMMVSILDVFDKNPYSRIVNTPFNNIENVRKDIASKVSKDKRFRKEPTRIKCLKINQLAREVLYQDFQKRNVFETTGTEFKKPTAPQAP